MFLTGIGRWMEEDPEGFNAGDPNLDRYCGDNPTNETDRSGLAEDPKVIYYNRGITYDLDKRFTGAERRAIEHATSRAYRKLQKAKAMLTTNWKEMLGLATIKLPGDPTLLKKPYIISGIYKRLDSTATKYIERDHALVPIEVDVREHYITKINEIFAEVEPKTGDALAFTPDRSDQTDTQRYCYIKYFNDPTKETIHVTNLFFELQDPDDQANKIVHELGRRVWFDDAERTGDALKDAYMFDETIDYLAKCYDKLMANNAKVK